MICLLGQNHKTAPVELREKLAVTEDKREALGEMLRREPMLEESVVLSTCNRMELYTVSGRAECPRERLGAMLAEIHGIPLREWNETLYYRRNESAVRHLFRVASGLDSMVLGEGQILAQVRDAHGWSTEQSLAREVLHRAFEEAVACGKFVRSETRVSEGSVSVASASVHLAKKIFSDLSDQSVLLVGAGDTGARVARHLQLFGVKDLRVTNRTRSRAEELARELDATVVPWQQLDDHLPDVSIVVTAVTSPEPVLTRERVRDALREGDQRTLFAIDLAVPRNIAPDVQKVPGVFLYDIDDLQQLVHDDEGARQAEAEKAEGIVQVRVEKFVDWYRARSAVPTLRDLRNWAEDIRTAELAAMKHKMPEESFQELERVTARLMNKFLHPPTVGLRRSVTQENNDALLRDVRRLFGLDDEPDPPSD